MAEYVQPIDEACKGVGKFYKEFVEKSRDKATGKVDRRPAEVGLTNQFTLALSQYLDEAKIYTEINETTSAIESVEGHDFTWKFNVNGKWYLVLFQAKIVVGDAGAFPDYKKTVEMVVTDDGKREVYQCELLVEAAKHYAGPGTGTEKCFPVYILYGYEAVLFQDATIVMAGLGNNASNEDIYDEDVHVGGAGLIKDVLGFTI
ncbi:hypothetical protein B0H11DRAFT_2206850 [Mycena galericulata]|nr:hypothetical protein B0H11DRAFT_2206850 [Mycena galericulata]